MGVADSPDKPRHLGNVLGSMRKTPQKGTEVPRDEFLDEPATGVVTGPELDERRARRKTPQRFRRLEERADLADDRHIEVLERIGGIDLTQAEHGVILKNLDEDRKARQADEADAKKHTRERWTSVIRGLFSGAVVVEILHRIGVL